MSDADLDYVKVVGRIGLSVGDGDDAGENPDLINPDAGGEVWFTPLTPVTKVVGAAGSPVTIGNAVIKCPIDADGYLTYNGQRHVWLVDLGSSKVNPSIPVETADYQVDFANIKFRGSKVTFPGFTCHPVPDTDNDLTLMAPVPSGTGEAIVVGPAGTGVADLTIQGGRLIVTLTDETVIDAGALADNFVTMTNGALDGGTP